MRIVSYTLCWNEIAMLPFYLRHYGQFCDKMVFYDQHSTDGTREMIKSFPNTEIRDREGDVMDVEKMNELGNQCYKEERGRADWVIVGDMDEIMYHSNFMELLRINKAAGNRVIHSHGYEMVSEAWPESGQIYDTITDGVRLDFYDKDLVFSPEIDIGYFPGRHWNRHTGYVRFPDAPLKLLHYKFIDREYVKNRYKELHAKRCKNSIEKNYGGHYENTDTSAKLSALMSLKQRVIS